MDNQLSATHVNALAVPSLHPSWKHHWVLLNHELDETNRQLVECQERIASLMALHKGDEVRLGQQQARILELEAQVKGYREKLTTATQNDATGRSATVFSFTHTR
jgi:chromosome segregation ATPase